MWNFILCLIVGFIGGILGGMGMGGGTLLIPLLTIFLKTEQHLAQAINLVSFVPMAIIALIFHIKNKLVEKKGLLYVIIPSIITSVLSSVFSTTLNGDVLKRSFGIFLIVLSVVQFFSNDVIKWLEKKKSKKKSQI